MEAQYPIQNAITTRTLYVTKRDGSLERFDVTQIREVLEWSTEGIPGVNALALEASFTLAIEDKLKTTDIQENLIRVAVSLASPEEPNWRYVAGRLHMWNFRQNTIKRRGHLYGEYRRIVRQKIESGAYDARLSEYSDQELNEANSWIEPSRDKDYDYAGAQLLTGRYLLPNELPQEAFVTCALLLALPEKPAARLSVAKRIYETLSCRKISLATPILANLRVPGGSLGSCFIVAMEDNLESIFREITNTARISKQGGGVGVNLSRVRAAGSWVMGKANASGGVIPWIKILNDTAIAVNQGGRRAGAVTVGLDMWHLDIEEFLTMQLEHGDQRRKAYDVFPQIVVPDEFMRRVERGEDWTLVDPCEVREKLGIELAELCGAEFDEAYARIEEEAGKTISLHKRVSARDLLVRVMQAQIETGLPYLAFKDTINKANPNKHMGVIPGVNLCTESFSVVVPGTYAHSCNLVSLNLANISDEELPEMCEIAVRLLDNTLNLTVPPFEDAGAHNNMFRTIGVGQMGLADWLASRHLSYKDVEEISYLEEDIAYHTTRASMELARERGPYPAFPGSEWSKGKMVGAKPIEWFKQYAAEPARWEELQKDIVSYGIRNSHIQAIAPNTSSSLVQGCTASILPVFSRFFLDKWSKGQVPIAPPCVGTDFWFYQENKHLDQQIVVEAVATIQEWVDTGVSMELIFNLNPGIYFPKRSIRAAEIFEVIKRAWARGCKAIYYVRTVQKDGAKGNVECSSCAG